MVSALGISCSLNLHQPQSEKKSDDSNQLRLSNTTETHTSISVGFFCHVLPFAV